MPASPSKAFASTGFRIISYQPLIIDFPDFLDASECQSIIRAVMRCSPESAKFTSHDNENLDPDDERLLFEERAAVCKLLSHVADVLQTPKHSGEVRPRCAFTAPTAHSSRAVPRGLHVDTNRRERRFATAIVYLASLEQESDGCTLFPCAGRGEAAVAARKGGMALLKAGHQHTFDTPSGNEAVEVLHRAACDENSFGIAPKTGRLAIFFSRDHNGAIDPASWHTGAAVLSEPSVFHEGLPRGKWSMQVFKEVPRDADCGFEAYAAQRWRAIASKKHTRGSQGKVNRKLLGPAV